MNFRVAILACRDSSDTRVMGIVTMLFFPAILVAVRTSTQCGQAASIDIVQNLFSTNMFDKKSGSGDSSPGFWPFCAATAVITIPVMLMWQTFEEINRKKAIEFIDKLLANSATRYTVTGKDSAQYTRTFRPSLWDLYLGSTPVTATYRACCQHANGISRRLVDIFHRKNATNSTSQNSSAHGKHLQTQPEQEMSDTGHARGEIRKKTVTIGLEEGGL